MNTDAPQSDIYPLTAVDDAAIGSRLETLEPCALAGGFPMPTDTTIAVAAESETAFYWISPPISGNEGSALIKPRYRLILFNFVSLISNAPRKRDNQRVIKGNNKTGRTGKLRCDTCRKSHLKVFSPFKHAHFLIF